jgi:SAM-dependent methyltransferase
MIWILYACFTGAPRSDAGDVFRQVCSEIKARQPEASVRIDEVGSKSALRAAVSAIKKQQLEISEWHFAGYGTPYGPLLGSPEWPEAISAHEWAALQIPFAKQAQAWLYMEGSATWLAPFMAAAFKITAYGNRHLSQTEFTAYSPGFWRDDADYNPIAALYAEAFSDITVRRDELRWLDKKIAAYQPARFLDIGCGNGALLAHFSDKIKQGVGVDISGAAIGIAQENNRLRTNLSFCVIEGPHLPFAEHTMDIIVSLLSFRYLDWDPILAEMKRVLAPGGHILIVDMLSSEPRLYEWPHIMADKLRNTWALRKRQSFTASLRRLVMHPDWRRMIDRHPMHPAYEFIWYLKSRFPNGEIKVLNTGVRAKILAFDSGPIM